MCTLSQASRFSTRIFILFQTAFKNMISMITAMLKMCSYFCNHAGMFTDFFSAFSSPFSHYSAFYHM